MATCINLAFFILWEAAIPCNSVLITPTLGLWSEQSFVRGLQISFRISTITHFQHLQSEWQAVLVLVPRQRNLRECSIPKPGHCRSLASGSSQAKLVRTRKYVGLGYMENCMNPFFISISSS